ncbi:MAG: M23 family peptidase, partial [Xanthobacteraceae bacterium]
MRVTLKVYCLAGLLFASTAAAQEAAQEAAPGPAAGVAQDVAPEMKSPRVLSADVDWGAVRAALADFAPLGSQDDSGGATTDAVARLNEATKKIFPKIGVSPVPVLLPFDTAAFLRDEAAGGAVGGAVGNSKYLSGFDASTLFFFPGPAGYDAALSLQPRDNPGLDLTFGKRVDVQISGSAVIYELDVPSPSEGSPVPELDGQFPGIRRLLLENHLRYTFVRFGVPYFVTIGCDDGPKRVRRLSCREADKVGIRFLNALNVVGGAPPPPYPPPQAGEERSMNPPPQAGEEKSINPPPQTIDRPDKNSADFTYYAPGDILPGTGMRGQGGRADATVFSKIRFPMAQSPAYVNSQTFMNWGGCDFTGRVGLGGSGRNAAYRCKVNSVPLVHDESRNYAYPWRDNFCEHRYFAVAQCPAGLGHQGEDIRPGSCKLRNAEADRCEPYQHDIVAVRDGVVLRAAGDEALYLVVDAPGEHIRFRYLHMDPHMLDAAGMV